VLAHVTEFERQIKLSGGNSATERALKASDRPVREPKGQGSRPFKGYCNNCGRYGHRQSECAEDSDSGSDSEPGSGLDSAESTESSAPEGQEQGAVVKSPKKPRQPVETAGLALEVW